MECMDERQAFSSRLKQALRGASVDIRSPTSIAVKFNLRYYGSPVSTQAVRKWLEGSSIPKQDKIRTLGKWLKVSSEWLRYGEGDKRQPENADHLSDADIARNADRVATLPDEFARLSPRHKEMVCEIVQALLGLKK